MTNEQILDELRGLMAVETNDEILAAVRAMHDRNTQIAQPLVYRDPDGKMNIAPMTVRGANTVIAALEGLQVK